MDTRLSEAGAALWSMHIPFILLNKVVAAKESELVPSSFVQQMFIEHLLYILGDHPSPTPNYTNDEANSTSVTSSGIQNFLIGKG